ncbi:MAG: hypothetical protein ACPG49_02525 [Chitinophagales bacterium]
MKTLLKTSLFLLSIFSTNYMFAQSLVGLWAEPTYQMQLQLNPNGSYVLQYVQGSSYGQYGLQGNQFWLQDAYGNSLGYTVFQLTATNFQISDANGTVMNFVNQNPSLVTSMSPNNAVVPWEKMQYNRELAKNGAFVLKEKEVMIYATLLEFLIEANLKPNELKELQKAIMVDFEAGAKVLLQDAKQVEGALKMIYAQTDVMQIGVARQALFANFHAYVLQNPVLKQGTFFRILYEHLQVLAFDAANKLVLTDKDVKAYLKYVNFTNDLLQVRQPMTTSEKQTFQQQLTNGFAHLPLDQKQVFCSARLLWQVVEANWSKLTRVEQEQAVMGLQSQMSKNPYSKSSQSNRSQEASDQYSQMDGDLKRWAAEKGMTVEEYLEYRRGFNASFPMLQNASMQNHTTMMNVIENMGGGDSYWSVQDVDSSGNIVW